MATRVAPGISCAASPISRIRATTASTSARVAPAFMRMSTPGRYHRGCGLRRLRAKFASGTLDRSVGARASRFALLLPAVFGCFLARPAAAMSEEERDATFWKVGVTDFAGKTQYLDGATAAVRFAVGLRDSKRFHVMAPNAVRRSVIQTGSDISRGELSEADAKKICRQLVIDGVFAGRIEPGANGYSSLT